MRIQLEQRPPCGSEPALTRDSRVSDRPSDTTAHLSDLTGAQPLIPALTHSVTFPHGAVVMSMPDEPFTLKELD
ncbi:hypothetical protein, partial [Pseudomonas sp. IT-347P]|uniref:hypothetical protein n=1 Tax=Pseudomonas sp. IT-347P TaxID=3026458 RepID=UPI0039DF963F